MESAEDIDDAPEAAHEPEEVAEEEAPSPISTLVGEEGAEGAAVVAEGMATGVKNLDQVLKRKRVCEKVGGKPGRTKRKVVSSEVSS